MWEIYLCDMMLVAYYCSIVLLTLFIVFNLPAINRLQIFKKVRVGVTYCLCFNIARDSLWTVHVHVMVMVFYGIDVCTT